MSPEDHYYLHRSPTTGPILNIKLTRISLQINLNGTISFPDLSNGTTIERWGFPNCDRNNLYWFAPYPSKSEIFCVFEHDWNCLYGFISGVTSLPEFLLRIT